MDEIGSIKNRINIRDINSSFIIKNIFSFLPEKQILNLIINNKQFQTLLSVDIKNYKKISGKYKIGEKNGKGKEYSIEINKLIFEGEYLNGKRNGKGKEYNRYGELEFEREYLNGKRNGKGKEYYYNGRSIFEGEYLNGKRWNGKGYNKNGIIDFEIKNGKGKLKEYDLDGKL